MKSFVRKWMLLLAVLAAILAGCTDKSDGEGSAESDGDGKLEGELNVAVFQGGYGGEFWKQLAKNFEEEYPGTTVKVTANPDIGEMIRPKIIAGNPPDFVYLNQTDPSGVTQGLIKEHGLTDLTDVFEGNALDEDVPLKDKVLPGILESVYMSPYDDGKIYLAPYNYNVMGLWYNKTLFEKNNIETPKTWDEFFALNKTAKKHDRALFTYQGTSPGYLEEILIPAVYSLGGQEALDQMLNYDPEFWKSDVAMKALDIFDKIASKDNALMNGTVALDHTQSQTAFMQGKAMFIPNGSWFEGEMENAPREDGFEFGFLGVPTFDKEDPLLALNSIEQVYIPKGAKNPELAKEFLRFMYTEESIKLNGELAKASMAIDGASDLVKEYLTESSYNVFKAVESGMYSISGNFAPVPKGVNVNPREVLFSQAASIMNGEMTTQEWADKMYGVYKEVQEKME
ncbi:carbohydrate ABC transporter substrate-binding protein [Virgibacillus phasianinus]|uniref:Carbohydrate ABC transporter substrate-binding protein n=1 Tax=Virgibacillus phasianinus TaxID=2017483 RepID=A0A220U1T2_9BACI|nr:carbohydrate ABC transporter substrate-binding protein [Virgibacillus phasianinus]ASK62194.1 carbohydrate ABC transporter substrate-binding protein [Virgibacillus phasianinus]